MTGNATYAGKLIDLQRGGTSLVAIDNSSGLVSTVQIQLSGNFTQTGATTFSTGTSTVTLNGPVTLAANVGVTAAAGTGGLDFSLASGTFKTGSGAVSLNGDTTVTGTKFFTANGATTLNGSLTLGSASLQGGVIVSSAAGVVSAVAPGTSGNVLTSNGTTWVSQAASGGGGNALFGSAVDGTGGNCGTLTAATVTLTRDIYCTSLTVGNGSTATTLKTAGFKIYVQGALIVANLGTIDYSGNNAIGATGGLTAGSGSLGGSQAGASGVVNGIGGSLGAVNPGDGGNGGNGGAGAKAAGTGGTVTQSTGTDTNRSYHAALCGCRADGTMVLFYNTYTNSGTVQAAGGSAGAGGGGGGVAGSAGSAGNIYQYQN